MPTYTMLVTDVTNYGSLFCVAGLDMAAGTMLRPEPPSARANSESTRFWQANIAGPGKAFAIGNIVRFEANLPPADFAFPHATEDRIVTSTVSVVGQLTGGDIAGAARHCLAKSADNAFHGALVRPFSGKAYVPSATQGPSLGGIEIPGGNLTFHENTYGSKSKLRAYLDDGLITYDAPVTSDALHTEWRANGLNALQARIGSIVRVQVRVGLSRPFAAKPDECYMQINGILPT